MRWATFLAILFAAYLLQALLPIRPEYLPLLLALAIVCGLNAPTDDARIAAWLCGLMLDLTGEPHLIGVNSLAFGLTGLILTWLRESGLSAAGPARFIIAVLAAWPGQFLYDILVFASREGGYSVWAGLARTLLTASIAAVVALIFAVFPVMVLHRRRLGRAGKW